MPMWCRASSSRRWKPVLGQEASWWRTTAPASGMRATEDVSNAAPMAIRCWSAPSSQLVHNIALFEPLPVDIESTLRGVAMINEVPMVMCVPTDSPDADLGCVSPRACRPIRRRSSMARVPRAPPTHISGALFFAADRGRGPVVHIPYPRSPEGRMVDLIAGRLSFVFDPSLTAIGAGAGAGAVRPMGVSAPVRLAALSDVPDDGRGGPDPASSARPGTPSPPPQGTPDEIVMALNGMINEIVQADAMRARLEELASIVPAAKNARRGRCLLCRAARDLDPRGARHWRARRGAEATFCPARGSRDSAQGYGVRRGSVLGSGAPEESPEWPNTAATETARFSAAPMMDGTGGSNIV